MSGVHGSMSGHGIRRESIASSAIVHGFTRGRLIRIMSDVHGVVNASRLRRTRNDVESLIGTLNFSDRSLCVIDL